MDNCIFCKIIEGELPSRKIYEDDDLIAFHDIRPQAPVHFMVIPKQHVASMAELTPEHAELMGKLMVLAPRLAREQGLNDGFRLIVNTGRVGCQEVPHLHVHIAGGSEPLGRMIPKRGS